MKKIFACAFLLGMCSFSVFAETDWSNILEYVSKGKECRKLKRSTTPVGGCVDANNKFRPGPCNTEVDLARHNGHAIKGECIEIKLTPNDKTLTPTCAATLCKKGYSLWLGWQSDHAGGSGEWVSMGVCHDDRCNCGVCDSAKGGRCVRVLDLREGESLTDPEDGIRAKYGQDGQEDFYNKCMCEYDLGKITIPTIPVTQGKCDQFAANTPEKKCCDAGYDVNTKAFECCVYKEQGHRVTWNKNNDKCECEIGEWNDTKKICECKINVSSKLKYICSDESNTVISLDKSEDFKVPVPVGVDQKCEDMQDIVSKSINEGLGNISKTIDALKKICEDLQKGSVSSVSSSGFSSLDDWIRTTDSSRSKWKDAAGNFNGARLASDLTAGVVLGTVGGVVSGVVIKKKQVEKGFDALNCYVGGQKMADWGDEFRIEYFRQ